MQEERQRSDRRANEAARCATEEERRKFTLIVPPDDSETFYPQGRLEAPYLRVCAPTRQRFAESFDVRMAMMRMRMEMEVVSLRARQMAMVLPNGAKVVWWTWEMAG